MNTNRISITRRQALQTVAATALGAGLAGRLAARDAHAAKPAPLLSKPTLHVYDNYGWLRGLGMVPSWAARIEDAWWFYDGAKMREEVALARQIHVNCIRLWIEFTAWFRDPDKVTASFLDAVAAIAENGMKVMPCLFNRWHDSQFDYGGTYVENIEQYQGIRRDLGKPLLVNETIPGCLDDAKRAEVVKLYTEQLSDAGFGWMGWVIREGRAISTRRDRYDGNGINGQGFHPFLTKEGKLRAGLEFLTEQPKLRAPWEKA